MKPDKDSGDSSPDDECRSDIKKLCQLKKKKKKRGRGRGRAAWRPSHVYVMDTESSFSKNVHLMIWQFCFLQQIPHCGV